MSLKKCSIRDVAALAGVSISTVSRILNNHEKAKTIPPEVHKRVQECARQLEYVPNANARRVFSHRAGIIGLLVPSYRQMKMHIFEDGHLRRLISGIEEGLGENKYRLLLIFNDEQFQENREYMSLIRSQDIDGLLVWGAQPDEEYWREPVEAGLPVVFAVTLPGKPEAPFNYVINATREGARRALQLLLDRGHRRIMYLRETGKARFLVEQMDLAVREMEQQRPDLKLEWVDISRKCEDLPVERFRQPLPPTAILSYNYAMAEEAIGVLAAAGYRVPDNLEVVSCYSFQSKKGWVSTIVVDDFEIGRLAAEAIQKLIEQPDYRVRLEVPAELIQRKTTKAQ